jgi:hypothetical protein
MRRSRLAAALRCASACVLMTAAAVATAGRSEWNLVDRDGCKVYTLSSELGSTAIRPPQDHDAELRAARQALSVSADWHFFELLLHSGRDPAKHGDATRLLCRVTEEGRTRTETLECRSRESTALDFRCRSRADAGRCEPARAGTSQLMIYWIDTTEYEQGGKPDRNPAFQNALRSLRSKCKGQ